MPPEADLAARLPLKRGVDALIDRDAADACSPALVG